MYRANKNISNYIKIVIQVLQYFFVLLFVYAAVSKLIDFETFRVQLAQSPLLSAYAGILAWAVPIAELVIAGLLCFEPTKKLGLSGFFFMMVMFSAYIFFILKFADFVPCSCGGVLEKMSWGQHLVFNLLFVALSGIILYFGMGGKRRRRWMVLGAQFILGIGVVGVLFAFSERKMQRNNAFQRRYLPHPLIKLGEYDLQNFGHYIAGVNDETIYLGNYTAPLYLNAIDTTLKEIREIRVTISNMELPYRRAKTEINPPYFYLGDGTVPILFRGKMKEWSAIPFSYMEAYFTQYTVADSLLTGFVTTSSKTGSNAIGKFDKRSPHNNVQLNVLGQEKYSGIATDGTLLYNAELKKFIYLFYYKNEYKIINKELIDERVGNTIDTISTPILDVAQHSIKGEMKVGGKSVLVNLQSSTSGNYLFIHSNRLGKFEDDKILNSASIIDVYDIRKYTYAFSFYLFHQRDEKLTEFKVINDLLIAIVGDRLWLFRLKSVYFDIESNPSYTGQYQDFDRTPVKNSRSLIY